MKKIALFLGGFFLCTTAGRAQGIPSLVPRERPPVQPWAASSQVMLGSVSMGGPLVLLGSQETDFSSLLVNPRDINVVKIYQDTAILAPMGRKARYGVVLIELKSKKTLLKLDDVLDYFKVTPAQRQMKVLVNRRPVNKDRFLADVTQIEKLEVITQDKISATRLSWDENEQFLNIVTVKDVQ
jgi:hypothetical protein